MTRTTLGGFVAIGLAITGALATRSVDAQDCLHGAGARQEQRDRRGAAITYVRSINNAQLRYHAQGQWGELNQIPLTGPPPDGLRFNWRRTTPVISSRSATRSIRASSRCSRHRLV